MIVKRLVRPEPTTVLTDDGYLYEWPQGGEALDVLEHHRRSLLAAKGAHLVEVDVEDQPVVLPALRPVEPLHLATVLPESRPADDDLTGATVKEQQDAPTAHLRLATIDAAPRDPDPVVEPKIGHRWSDEDLARLEDG